MCPIRVVVADILIRSETGIYLDIRWDAAERDRPAVLSILRIICRAGRSSGVVWRVKRGVSFAFVGVSGADWRVVG